MRLAIIVALILFGSANASRATSYVVFRYDDLAADQPGEREYNATRRAIWEAEQAMDRIFEEAALPYVVAVIPEANPAYLLRSAAKQRFALSADPEKVTFVKRAHAAGRMQVAMHGFTHTNYRGARAKASEFSRPYDAQYQDLVAGRKILMDTLGLDRLTTFVPPFNGWSPPTAPALLKSGFEILSADRYQPGDASTSLIQMPFTAQLWDLDDLVSHGSLPDNGVVVVLLHPPQITQIARQEERFYGLDRLTALVAKLKAQPDVRVVNFDQLRAARPDFTATRYVASAKLEKLRSLWSQALPASSLPGTASYPFYLGEEDYRRVTTKWLALTAAAFVVLFAVGFAAGRGLGKFLGRGLNLALAAVALAGLAAGAWLVVEITRRGFHPNSIRVFPLLVLAGVLVATLSRVAARRPLSSP